jgi:P-type Cu2+ transporter
MKTEKIYTCPMHPEIRENKPGLCPKCGGMPLQEIKHKKLSIRRTQDAKIKNEGSGHEMHGEHVMKPVSDMTFWGKVKMGFSMTMGMDHTGLAGREMAKLMEEDIRNKFFFSLILTIPVLAYSMGEMLFGWHLPSPLPVPWLLFLLTTPVFFIGGWLFLYSSYFELKTGRLGMSVLIAVGITAAYVFSFILTLLGSHETFYEAAAMLITFVLFGHWMEMKSRRGTTDALQALFALVPPLARILRGKKEELIQTENVKIGDILILKPGDKIPVDGEITEGETTIDESLVTGESLPVSKKVGDLVIAGSINQSGSVRFKATKVGSDTALSQIVKMVETAQSSKAPGQRLADKFAKYLVILAVGSGIATFAVWYLVLGQPLLFALTFAISAVVIACPDALGLATPTAVAVGTGLGAKHNILIKDAPTLEQVSKIQTVVLDKTGTLTDGKPKVTKIITVKDIDEKDALHLIAAAEEKSSHPLSTAVLEEAKKRKISIRKRVEKFENISGLGVKAVVDGKNILVGTARLMEKNGIDLTPLKKEIDILLSDGQTIMILAIDNEIQAVIGASDPIKPSAKKTIERLHNLGIKTAMITGDNKKTAEAVAKKLGINRVFADVLPQDKEGYIKKLQREGKFVAMVGDGVNDAPALATADIGIAIGAGTDVAIETAKVVLMKSDPLDILRAITLSKATVMKMKQNLFWASFYNILAIPIAAGVLYPAYKIALRPEWAALLMSMSSIIVAVNAVSLKRVETKLLS